MTTLQRLRRVLLVCALVAGGLLAAAGEARATHFRYGSITWQVTNPAQPNLVRVRFDAAFRWSFPWGSFVNACPGPPFVATGGVGTGSCPPLGRILTGSVGNIVIRNAATNATITTLTIGLTVTSINSTEDWFTGTFESTPLALPGTTADYILEFSNTARISNLRDMNNDQPYTIRSRVTVRLPPAAVNQPPTVATLPVLTLALGQPTSFPITAADPNGDAISFSISPPAETGLITAAPSGFGLSPAGIVNWTPNAAGLYAVQVKVTDTAGAFTVADLILNVKPQTGQPPTVSINGNTTPQALTAVYGTPISFAVAASDPENSPVLLSHGSLPPGATMSPSLPLTAVNPGASFSWTPTQAAIGTYVLNFAGLDGDGRQDTNAITLTITGNPPTVSCTTSPSPIEASGVAGEPFTITASADDPDGDQLTVRFLVDAIERQASGLVPAPTTQSFTGNFGIGTHGYEVRVGDGLTVATCTGSFTVRDTTAPSLAVMPGDQILAATGPAGAVATWVVISSDAVDFSPTISCNRASGSVFPLGSTDVTCRAFDDAGNIASTTFRITVQDQAAPVVTAPTDLVLEATGPVGAPASFTATALDNVDGPLPASCTPPSGWTFALGTTAVDCQATDSAGQTGSASFLITVQDTTAPAFAAPANIVAEATGPAGAAVDYALPTATDVVDLLTVVTCAPAPGATFPLGTTTVSCSSSDLAGNTTTRGFQVTVRDTTAPVIGPLPDVMVPAQGVAGALVGYLLPPTSDAVSGPGTAACAPPPGSLFGLGTTPVLCTATDAAGNLASAGFAVLVFNTAPAFIPPPDIAVPATSPAGAVVTFSAAGTDAEQGAIPAVCAPASSATFPLGATVVSCTVTDVVGATATGSFTVTVTNNPPTFTAPANLTREATGPAGAVVTFTASGEDVEQGSIPAVCTPASGSTFPRGTTTVQCTVTDAAGASAAGSFTVTVVDNGPPTFDPGSLGPHTVAGSCSAGNVSFPLPRASDGGVPVPVTCTPISATRTGKQTSVCTAVDAAGNTARVTVTVTVLAPLRVVFRSPLSDDNVANDVNTDADVVNSFTPSQTVAHKVRLLSCNGSDVTCSASVVVKLAVNRGATGTGGPNLINDRSDISGIGKPDGTMEEDDGAYQLNLKTSKTDYPRGEDFRSLVTVAYRSAPAVIVGVEDARLRAR